MHAFVSEIYLQQVSLTWYQNLYILHAFLYMCESIGNISFQYSRNICELIMIKQSKDIPEDISTHFLYHIASNRRVVEWIVCGINTNIAYQFVPSWNHYKLLFLCCYHHSLVSYLQLALSLFSTKLICNNKRTLNSAMGSALFLQLSD